MTHLMKLMTDVHHSEKQDTLILNYLSVVTGTGKYTNTFLISNQKKIKQIWFVRYPLPTAAEQPPEVSPFSRGIT